VTSFHASLRADPAAAAGVSRDERVGARIDAVRDAYAGPYVIDGASVGATPMFRIHPGFNHASMMRHAAEVDALGRRLGVSGPLLRMGQASPRAIVVMTQALVDAGRLPREPAGDPALRIKRMQWEYGIGVDCAAYTRFALEAALGVRGESLGLRPLGYEGFRGLDGNACFARVPPHQVRPGDVVTLDPLPPEIFGHNVIVRSRRELDPAACVELARRHGRDAPELVALTTRGPLHAIEVDSSWGAGPSGADIGGYRRETWWFDEASRSWAHFDHAAGRVVVSAVGPAREDRFHGAYRAREAR